MISRTKASKFGVFIIAVTIIISGIVKADSFTFLKVADTNTPVPQGLRTFGCPLSCGAFRGAAIENRTVTFRGRAGTSTFGGQHDQEGIYKLIDGVLDKVADRNTVMGIICDDLEFIASSQIPDEPGGAGVCDPFEFVYFQDFGLPSLDRDKVAFWGRNRSTPVPTGIFTDMTGGLTALVTKDTPRPNGDGPFGPNGLGPGDLTFDEGSIAFISAGVLSTTHAIVTNLGGSLHFVADENTPIPNGIGSFTRPSGSQAFKGVMLHNGEIVFIGEGDTQQGVYSSFNGFIDVVADETTTVPGGTGTFTQFSAPAISNSNITFLGIKNSEIGIFSTVGGVLNAVGDSDYGGVGVSAIDGENIAFLRSFGSYSGYQSIVTNLGGSLTKIIDTDDELEGKSILGFSFGREGLSGNQIVFTAIFDDGSEGLYIAEYEAAPGDVNYNGVTDVYDLNLIRDLRNQPVSWEGDPRDLDGDGMITLYDVRKAVLQCTNPRCAP